MDKALHDRIAKVAYELYERKGKRDNCHEEDWLEAERIVRAQMAKEESTMRTKKPLAGTPKAAVKATPQKAAAKKAAPAEAKKKAAKLPARTSISRKKLSPEATI